MERSLATRNKPKISIVRSTTEIERRDPNRDLGSMAEQIRLQQRRSWRRFIFILASGGLSVVLMLGLYINHRVPSLKELSSAVSGSIDSSPAISRIEQKVDNIQAAQQQPQVVIQQVAFTPEAQVAMKRFLAEAEIERDKSNQELRKKNQELEATLKKEWDAKKKALSENKQLKSSLVRANQKIEHEQTVGRVAQKEAYKVIDKRGEIINAIWFSITRVESGGNYRANCDRYLNGETKLCLGKYQVNPTNLDASNPENWGTKHYGRAVTPAEFCGSEDIQDIIARGQLGEYWDQTQDARKVASLWHGHTTNYLSLASDGNMTTKEYVENVIVILRVIRPDLTRFPKEKKSQVASATGRKGRRR